jgi:2-methylcitrate dehydratase PrpD
VVIKLGPQEYNLVGQPFTRVKYSQVKAQFSVQYGVANVLVRGRPRLEHYTEKHIFAPEVQNFLPRVRVVLDKNMSAGFKSEVQIKLRGGKTYHKVCGPPKGHPENPLKREDLITKFMDCVRYSSKPLSDECAKNVIDKILRLDKLSNIGELLQLFLN